MTGKIRLLARFLNYYVQVVPKRLFLLLPPSESKRVGGHSQCRHDEFAQELKQPRTTLKKSLLLHISAAESPLARTFKSSGQLLQRSIEANRESCNGSGLVLPTWRRYSGVVWVHLDPESLSTAQRHRLLVPSALHGLTTGRDEIGEYRLAMSASIDGVGRLATYWREPLTQLLTTHCRGGIVVNLLTSEFDPAIDSTRLAECSRVVNVRFVSADEQKAVGHDAKAVKGFLARSILLYGLKAIDDFAWMGWRARKEQDQVTVVAPAVRQMVLATRSKKSSPEN